MKLVDLSPLLSLLPLIILIVVFLFIMSRYFFSKLEGVLRLTNRTLRYNAILSSLILVFWVIFSMISIVLVFVIGFYFRLDFITSNFSMSTSFIIMFHMIMVIILLLKLIIPFEEEFTKNYKHN